jgi:hypothetical protein
MQRLVAGFGIALALAVVPADAKSSAPVPADDALPAMAASLADRLAEKTLRAPDGSDVALGTFLDAGRLTTCLRTIAQGGGWPASWLIVSDSTKSYDLVVRVALAPDGTIADPETAFLASRRAWDDATFDTAFVAATGKKRRERQRNVVVQSFTKKIDRLRLRTSRDRSRSQGAGPALEAADPRSSGGRLATEAPHARDRAHSTLFVPADCSTDEGRRTGHRDAGGILLVLAGESELEDKLDITEVVRTASGANLLPRFVCEPGDADPGAIDALVDERFEGREPVRLLDLSGRIAQSRITGLPVIVGIKASTARSNCSPRRANGDILKKQNGPVTLSAHDSRRTICRRRDTGSRRSTRAAKWCRCRRTEA